MPALELDIKTIKDKNSLSFTVQVVKQKYRGVAANYVTSKGFTFFSMGCPAVGSSHGGGAYPKPPTIYLRGSSRTKDNSVLYTDSVGYIEKLKVAVEEYNIAKELV